MVKTFILSLGVAISLFLFNGCDFIHRLPQGSVINHECCALASIPAAGIETAKSSLHIAYGHTSHGSQLITGMSGLAAWKGSLYAWNNGGAGGALDIRDTPFAGALDLGNPLDNNAWYTSTRNYLLDAAHADINVVIWSWCGEVSYAPDDYIPEYLTRMSALEEEFPNVQFVYMTGHLDGTGLSGNLHQRNEQIRAYCRANNKWLYDFADIESYDPDGNYYLARFATDGCCYDANNNGATEVDSNDPTLPVNGDRNWASDWQAGHVLDTDWYNCSAVHSVALNGNLKAYAAWWLWARLAGWNGQ
jgi:hypothetical protein